MQKAVKELTWRLKWVRTVGRILPLLSLIIFLKLEVASGSPQLDPPLDPNDISIIKSRYKSIFDDGYVEQEWLDPNYTYRGWYSNQIRIPRKIAESILNGKVDRKTWEPALRRFLSMQALSEWNGANTVWRGLARLGGGLALYGDGENDDEDWRYLEEAVDQFTTSTSQGDYCRIVPDWSYHFHWDRLNMAYGTTHFEGFTYYLYISEGTSFAVNNRQNRYKPNAPSSGDTFYQWFHNFVRWIIYQGYSDPYAFTKEPHLRLGVIGRRMVDILLGLHYPEYEKYRQDLENVKNFSPEPIGAMSYPQSNYLVIRRPRYYVSLRLVNLVQPHEEWSVFAPIFGALNFLTPKTISRIAGVHESDGVLNHTYCLLNTMTLPDNMLIAVSHPGDEYSNRKYSSEIYSMVQDNWGYYGVSTLGGYYAIGGENLKAPHFGMRKSWFFFDDEIVSLASNIWASSSDLGKVRTYLNTFKIQDTDFQTSAGSKSIPNSIGSIKDLGQITWVYHDNTGYIFPYSPHAFAEGVDFGYARVYLDHGVNPANAKYAAILLLDIDESYVKNYASHPDVEILRLDGQVHAVMDKSSGVVGAAFFEPAQLKEAALNLPGYLLYQAGDKFRLSLYNPHREKKITTRTVDEHVNPMIDYKISPEDATYKDYDIEIPYKLIKGSDPSLSNFTLSNIQGGTRISVKLRVYRKFEMEGSANSDGSYTITSATIGLNDASLGIERETVSESPDTIPPAPPSGVRVKQN